MEKFRNGEMDIDQPCSEQRAKPKFVEGGAVVDKRDVDKILGDAYMTSPSSGQLTSSDANPYPDFQDDESDELNFDSDVSGSTIDDLSDKDDMGSLHDQRKIPGPKPLTSKATSVFTHDSYHVDNFLQKRKAQNRAAQRAFRKRKEWHLKDLEAKVEELERNSESATTENSLLRAHVERLQVELKDYRMRHDIGDNQQSQFCSMFTHYTISEDRCGDDASVRSGLLAALGARNEGRHSLHTKSGGDIMVYKAWVGQR